MSIGHNGHNGHNVSIGHVQWTCGWTQWTCPMDTMDVHCVHSEFSVFVGCVHFGKWTQCVHSMDTMDTLTRHQVVIVESSIVHNGHNGRPMDVQWAQWTQWTSNGHIVSIVHNGRDCRQWTSNGHNVSIVSTVPIGRPLCPLCAQWTIPQQWTYSTT